MRKKTEKFLKSPLEVHGSAKNSFSLYLQEGGELVLWL
jgi:hypothetical protein